VHEDFEPGPAPDTARSNIVVLQVLDDAGSAYGLTADYPTIASLLKSGAYQTALI